MRIHLRKEDFKFSSAHMTVFPDGSKEPLHGHNYQVQAEIEIADTPFREMISFSDLKAPLRTLVKEWDEKLLLAERNPFFIKQDGAPGEFAFTLCKKKYLIPVEETLLLPIENISSENLATELLRRYIAALQQTGMLGRLKAVQVRVDETLGQGASASWSSETP